MSTPLLETRSAFLAALLLAGALPLSASAAESALPWLGSLGAEGRREAIHTIGATAAVSVSDGLTYAVDTVFHDAQRAVFRRRYEDRTVTQGVEGRYVWATDGREEIEAPPAVEEIVLGHQFHAQILFFDRLHPEADAVEAASFAGREARVLSADGTLGTLTAQVHARGARLDADGALGEPLDFVSAWIELYEKIDGRWRLTGNVSNFRPTPGRR